MGAWARRAATLDATAREPVADFICAVDHSFLEYDAGWNRDEWEHHFYDASYAIRFLRSRFRPSPALDSYPPAAPITLRLEMPRLPAVFCQLSAMPWPGTDCYC